MAVTSTDSWDITSASAWGTIGADCTTAGTATKYSLKGEQPIPRKYKDKNGCVKKSYWDTQAFDIKDLGGLGFNVSAGDAYTISTSGVANMTMGDTDDAQGSVCVSSVSA